MGRRGPNCFRFSQPGVRAKESTELGQMIRRDPDIDVNGASFPNAE